MLKSENEHGPKVLDFQCSNMMRSLGGVLTLDKGNTYLAWMLYLSQKISDLQKFPKTRT